jgi:hypothetical protein
VVVGDLNVAALGVVVCYLAVVLGIALRLRQVLANRSLSQDEAMLALNIVDRPFSKLFGRLDFLQGAPAAFLAVARLAVDVFGNSEYALRLFPLVAGVLAVLLMFPLARESINAKAVPVAAALFALSDPVVEWSSHAKPYAVDAFVTVVVLWAGLRLVRHQQSSAILVFSIVGAAAIWLSNPSVFVLAGLSVALVGGALLRRDWRRAQLLALGAGAWVVSFGVFAFTLLDNFSGLQNLECPGCFAGSATGDTAGSGDGLGSLRGSFGEFRYAAGIPHFLDYRGADAGLVVFVFAATFCLIGLRSLWKRRPEIAAGLLLPLGFMLIAWGAHKYPTLGRTQLFLVPNFILLLAEGFVSAFAASRGNWSRILGACGGATVAIAIGSLSLVHAAHPRSLEDVKSVLDYLGQSQRQGDTLYVYYTAQYQLRYYLECDCGGTSLDWARKRGLWPFRPGPGGRGEFASALLSVPPGLVVSKFRGRDPEPYVSDFVALQGRKRVWFLLSSLETSRKDFLLRALDRVGTRRASFSVGAGKNGASVYLYDLT